jgi:hypothetical protein
MPHSWHDPLAKDCPGLQWKDSRFMMTSRAWGHAHVERFRMSFRDGLAPKRRFVSIAGIGLGFAVAAVLALVLANSCLFRTSC